MRLVDLRLSQQSRRKYQRMQDWKSGTNASEVPVILFLKAGTVNMDQPEHGGCKAIRNVSTCVSTCTSRGRARCQAVGCRSLSLAHVCFVVKGVAVG